MSPVTDLEDVATRLQEREEYQAALQAIVDLGARSARTQIPSDHTIAGLAVEIANTALRNVAAGSTWTMRLATWLDRVAQGYLEGAQDFSVVSEDAIRLKYQYSVSAHYAKVAKAEKRS